MINRTKNKKTKNNTKKIILLFVSLVALYFLAIAPIAKSIEQNRFEILDNNMQDLFSKLNAVSTDTEVLTYEKKCDQQISGDWPTGKFYCKTIINFEKSVGSADEVGHVQEKYYPIIDNVSFLKSTEKLTFSPLESFSKDFVVSSAEKRYTNKNGFICDFSVDLYKNDGSYTIHKSGDAINSDEGLFALNIICSNLSNHDWYAN